MYFTIPIGPRLRYSGALRRSMASPDGTQTRCGSVERQEPKSPERSPKVAMVTLAGLIIAIALALVVRTKIGREAAVTVGFPTPLGASGEC